MERYCCAEQRRTGSLVLQVLCVAAVVFSGVVTGFNVDTVNFMKYNGPKDSMFGFSVAEHRKDGISSVLVGAPSAMTRQPGVDHGGAVYRCNVTDDSCVQVLFDRSGNNRDSTGNEIDQKSRQWFGATVYSSTDGNAVVACAPRYVYFPEVTNPRHDPVGTCYVAREQFSHFSEYSPCRTSEWGYHRQGSCQAGLSASMSPNGKHLFIGAPGSWYWQGELYSIKATLKHGEVLPGQLFSQNIHQRPNVLATGEGPATDDDTYFGYSVTVGKFAGDETICTAVGRPRGNQLVGKVLLYTWNLTLLNEIVGDQLGAYFGYSLCAADLDGDGLDDLVVGTPLHTDLHNNEGKYETGRVYVYYQNEEFLVNNTRDGKNSKSRFGLSLASLGDVNKDGYGDIAVGAPYDGYMERGAVYIYLGSKNGILEKYSQVIYAEAISDRITTFGFSVSAGLDLDDNEYPDLVVGAYDSSTAVLLRTRPVVKMNASLSFNAPSKQISLEDLNCTVGNVLVICTSLSICLEYSGIGTERYLEVDVVLNLDTAKPKNPRMFFKEKDFSSPKMYTFPLTKNSLFCKTVHVFVQATIRDKLTPLNAEMTYSLRNRGGSQAQSVTGRRRYTRHLLPILDLINEPTEKDTLNIFKNCGKDNVCIPDLQLTVKPSVKKYLLGSGEKFEIEVIVDNKGDDAFEATFELKVPLGLSYINIVRLDERKHDIPVQCSPFSNITNNNTLKCDIGNPLPKGKHVHFKVLMQPHYTEGLRSQYEFLMVVNSSNPENSTTLDDNSVRLAVPIIIYAELAIKGFSVPPEVYWSSANYSKEYFTHEKEIGPAVTYIHMIKNKGPADIVEAEVFFLLPTRTLTGDNILYLLEQPITSGPIQCQHVPDVNYLNLVLEHKNVENHTEMHSWKESSSSSSDISSSKTTSGGTSVTSSEQSSVSSVSGEGSASGSKSAGGSQTAGGVAGEEHPGYRHIHTLQGQTNEGGIVLHKDEGLISKGEGSLSQGIQVTSQHSHHYQNHSTLSNRTEIHGGTGGTRVFTTSNYNASFSENGSPVHHFSNHSFSDTNSAQEGGRGRQNGRVNENRFGNSGYDTQHHGGGKILYNITRTHHSSPSSGANSGNAGGSWRQESNYDSEDNRGGYSPDSSQGLFRHYYQNFSLNNEGGQAGAGQHGSSSSSGSGQQTHQQWSTPHNVIETDNVDESRRSEEDGQYDNLGLSKVNKHRHSLSQSGDNIDASHHHGSSGLQDYSQLHQRIATYQNKTSDLNGGNVDHVHRHGSGRENYGSNTFSRTNIPQYTSSYWDVNNADHSLDQGTGSGSGYSNTWISSTSSGTKNWDERYDGDQEGSKGGTHRYISPSTSNSGIVDGTQHQNVDVSYAATGQHITGSGQNHRTSQGSSLTGGSSEDNTGTQDWHPERNFVSNIDHDDSRGRQFTVHSSWHSSSSSSSSQDEESDGGRRYPRNADEETLEDLLQCNATKCTRIHCVMGPLTKGKEVSVELRTRVWVPTMKKLSSNNRVVKTSSLMALQVTRLPYIGAPHKPILESNEEFTEINLTDSPVKPEIVPLWVVVLSAVAGAIILLLLIYLLWKCGFFKRNRPSDASEKEPLNRNGHYSAGDEAL